MNAYDTPVGLHEIAALLKVERGTVDQWRVRKLLPAPDFEVGGRPAWRTGTILDWAHRTKRARTARTALLTPVRITPTTASGNPQFKVLAQGNDIGMVTLTESTTEDLLRPTRQLSTWMAVPRVGELFIDDDTIDELGMVENQWGTVQFLAVSARAAMWLLLSCRWRLDPSLDAQIAPDWASHVRALDWDTAAKLNDVARIAPGERATSPEVTDLIAEGIITPWEVAESAAHDNAIWDAWNMACQWYPAPAQEPERINMFIRIRQTPAREDLGIPVTADVSPVPWPA